MAKRKQPTILVLREHDSVWTPEAKETVLTAAEAIHAALKEAGYRVVPIQIASPEDVLPQLKSFDPRRCIVFNWYEGVEEGGSDAVQVAQQLEALGFTFTGATPQALDLTSDKPRTRETLTANDIPTPESQVVEKSAQGWMRFPAIVQVANDHGSEYLTTDSVVHDPKGLRAQIRTLRSAGVQSLMVAEFADGREFTVALWGNEPIELLPLVEVDYSAIPPELPRLRTFDAKWTADSEDSQNVQLIPVSSIPRRLRNRIERICRETFCTLELRDYARIDVRLNGGEPHVIDVNANPDITPDSSFLKAAQIGGYTYSAMLDKIVQIAIQRAGDKRRKNTEPQAG